MREDFINGRVALYPGDCLDVLASLPECSVDSVVTDPPYHLTSIVKQFGGEKAAPAKDYSAVKDGATGAYARASRGFMGKQWDGGDIAFRPEMWAAVLRVLKPGGHIAAFSGTRTYHRMACAIEDAGFEIRDQLAWTYGCLTNDVEILTESGWVLGVDVVEGVRVAAWDAHTRTITFESVEQKTRAPYAGSLVRFVNDDVDQVLTPNHRVYHLPRQRRMEKGARASFYSGTYEVAEAAMINRWNNIKLPMAGLHDGPGIGGEDYAALLGWVWTEGGFDRIPSRGVRIYQSPSANPVKADEIHALVTRIVPGCKRYDRDREYVYGATRRIVSEACWFFTGKIAERVRADLPSKHPTWDLLWRMSLAEKRAFYAAAMKGDGSGHDFYQKEAADLEWFQTLLCMIGYRGKIALRKTPRDGGSVCVTPRDTTEFQCRHLRHASVDYIGDVWCVKVRTGAFVARRSGRIFITGNSGFPKSHDVSRAIDRHLGHERATVRIDAAHVRNPKSIRGGHDIDGGDRPWMVAARANGYHEAASSEAAAWQGWGSALKPSWEPICLGRKPLSEGTVAANVLRWRTGALNIGACRVGTEVAGWGGKGAGGNTWNESNNGLGKDGDARPVIGRWPANICHDGSDEIFARYFYTAKADSDDRLGSNHPTVKPVDLMQWLCRLITPPGGTVLDLFAGTGTTGEAAFRAGFNAVLIEREAEYQADIRRRMALCLAGPEERGRASVKARGLTADAGPLFGDLSESRGGADRYTESSPTRNTHERPDHRSNQTKAIG